MRHLPSIYLLVALTFCGTNAIAAQPALDQIVIADEVRTAFFEHAPTNLAGQMSVAVRAWCDQFRDSNRNAAPPTQHRWLCGDHRLEYFRGVYVTGNRGPRGLICEKSGTTDLQYFGLDLVNDLLEDGSCVTAHRSSKDTYELFVPAETQGGDA